MCCLSEKILLGVEKTLYGRVTRSLLPVSPGRLPKPAVRSQPGQPAALSPARAFLGDKIPRVGFQNVIKDLHPLLTSHRTLSKSPKRLPGWSCRNAGLRGRPSSPCCAGAATLYVKGENDFPIRSRCGGGTGAPAVRRARRMME